MPILAGPSVSDRARAAHLASSGFGKGAPPSNQWVDCEAADAGRTVVRLCGSGPKCIGRDSEGEWESGTDTDESEDSDQEFETEEESLEEPEQESEQEEENMGRNGRNIVSDAKGDDILERDADRVGGQMGGRATESYGLEGESPLDTPKAGEADKNAVFSPVPLSQALFEMEANMPVSSPQQIVKPSPRKSASKRRLWNVVLESDDEAASEDRPRKVPHQDSDEEREEAEESEKEESQEGDEDAEELFSADNAHEDDEEEAQQSREKIESACARLENTRLVRNAGKLLRNGKTGEFMDVIRAAAFLIGDGRLCRDGIRLGTKSMDWGIHLSVYEVARMLKYPDLPPEPEAYLQFPFVANRDLLGRARAWEACCSGVGKWVLSVSRMWPYFKGIQSKPLDPISMRHK